MGSREKFSSLIFSVKEEATLSAKALGPRSGRQGPRTEEKGSGAERMGIVWAQQPKLRSRTWSERGL